MAGGWGLMGGMRRERRRRRRGGEKRRGRGFGWIPLLARRGSGEGQSKLVLRVRKTGLKERRTQELIPQLTPAQATTPIAPLTLFTKNVAIIHPANQTSPKVQMFLKEILLRRIRIHLLIFTKNLLAIGRREREDEMN